MTQFTEEKKKEWSGDITTQRSKNRSEYAAGPAADPWFIEEYTKAVKEVADKNPNAHVLILGATPETRDIVLDHGLNLTIIDQSMEMIEKMDLLMKNTNRDRERVVTGNWLETPFADETFDLVMGDGVVNNIELQDQIKFYKEIKRILKPGGIKLTREGAYVMSIKDQMTIREILELYRQEQDFVKLFLRLNLCSEATSYDTDERRTNMAKMFENLENHKHEFLPEEWEKVMIWKGGLRHTIMDLKDQYYLAKLVFNDVEIIHRTDNILFSFWPFFKAVK